MPATTWLVLPTYNERANLRPVVEAADRELERAASGDHRILIVDDGSPDGTGELADELAAAHDAVEVLHRRDKRGLGAAYRAGFERALAGGAAVVVQMDADLSHDPAALPALIAATADADLVLGSRYVAGGGVGDWGLFRRLVSRAGGVYARAVLGMGVRDPTSGFRAIRRRVLEQLGVQTLDAEGYAFQVELVHRALRAGFRVVEVPIVFRERRHGDSKMSSAIALEAMWLLLRLRCRARADDRR